ncbi:hypothetical protein ABZY68_23010 [Streptomyces sp. NPDC006482]|uniref:hypothetical protein n=1 Tax=Streptomyces sp. NPDC006482 TaxID=3154306 RepID=UPI0033A64FBC
MPRNRSFGPGLTEGVDEEKLTADALWEAVTVVRPAIFLSYSGNARWRTKAGDEVTARL